MFSVKEMAQLVENKLILLNLFEWRAVSVLFLQTFNPKLEGSATGCSAICTQTVRTFENIQKI